MGMKKLNMGRLALTFCLVSAISISSAIPALADWEQQTDGNWKYKNDDGSYVTSSLIDGYYVNGDGIWLEDIKADNNVYGWKNEETAMKMGLELQETNGWDINPIIIYSSNVAGYGSSNDVIQLRKTDDGYDLTLKTRIKSDNNVKGLKALTYLICDDNTLYNAIFNSYEGDNDLYNINYDNFVSVESYQIKATNNNNSLTYTIKQ